MYKIKTYQKEKQRIRDINDMKLEQRVERAVTTMNKSQSSQVGKKKKVKKKRVAFKESGSEDERQQVFQRHPNVPPLNLPPRVPGSFQQKQSRLPKSHASSAAGSQRKKSYDNSSVENYNRYYQQPDEQQMEQPSEESFQIHRQSHNNQMQYLENQRRQKEQTKLNTLFEPRFVRDHNEIRMGQHMINQERLVNPDIDQDQYDQQEGHYDQNPDMHTAQKNYGLNWIAKPTREGFLYFQIPGTNTYQWSFPKVYDHVTKENKYLFISHWIKKVETTPQGVEKYWYHRSNPSFKQFVKPHSETYLIQAAIEGNLAYLEVYVKFKGDLAISDQQGRTALAHSILNDKKTFTQMICEFSTLFQEEPATFSNLLEMPDRHGNTPLFCAVRVNSTNQLKVLISYKCNLFHRKKNGNTCLHECATFNSVESLILLAPYCGKDLFSIINKEGMRAIDIAKKLKNHDAFQALQRLERNLMYQDAVIERDHKPMIQKQPMHQSGHLKKLKKPHLNMIREEEISSLSNSSQMVDQRDLMHLPPRNDIKKQQQKSFGEFDERKHFQHMHQQKKARRLQEQQVPNFKNYRDEIMNNNSQEEELDETYEDYERSFQPPQVARNIQNSMQHQMSEIRQPQPQLQKEDPYYGRMRHQKNHFEQYFGEDSYLKVDDMQSRQFPRKKKQLQPSRQWFQEDDSYIYRGDEDSQINHQIDKTLTNYDHSRTHKNSMYNSRLHRSNNYTIDDIEKQKFRVQKPNKRERGRSTSVQSYRNQGQSVVHQAYQNTTRTLVSFASYIYSGYEQLRDIMAVEREEESIQRQPRTTRGRSVQFFEEDQGQLSHHNSRSMRFQSMHERRQHSVSSRQMVQPQTTDSEDFQTAYARSKSRVTRQNSQIRQFPNDDFQSDEYQQQNLDLDQQYLNPQVDEIVQHQIQTRTKQTESISIQADETPGNFIKVKQIETIQKKVEISKHSIGVGSICIDDTVVKPIKRRKKKKVVGGSASAIADFSKASIASQQLKSSSKLIEYEKTRRTGRKLAKKAQEILMESKHFQSSDEEEKKQEIEDIEPEPHYMKEELQYLKIAQAYENKDAQMYQQEVSKMAELHKQQEKRMSEHLSQKSSNKRSIEEAAIQKQSTPTCQSTQREATNSNQQREELKEQNQQIQQDQKKDEVNQQNESIDKFYQKLALNNLSLTNIEDEQQTTLKKIDNTNEKTLLSFLNQCNIDGEVQFDFAECEISLNRYNVDQSDLELGQVKEAIPKQQDEQLQFFSECSFDSVFKECKILENEDKLSDCTFTHVQNGLLCAPERNSKYESINQMNRGQFFKSQNNSLLNQTPTNNINSSGLFQTLLNQNQSGICHNNRDSFMFDFQIPQVDQEKLEQVVKNNIKAIPLPRPNSRMRSGGLRKSTQSMGKKKKSEIDLPDLIQDVEIKKVKMDNKEENQQQNIDEQQAQEVIKNSPETKNEIVEEVVSDADGEVTPPIKQTNISQNESQANQSSPSLQPGALTQISDEDDTPIVDRATVTVIEDSPRKTDSPNEEEQKIEITDHLDPRSSKNGVLPLFKQQPNPDELSAEKPQVSTPIPSTRYSQRDEEPSRIDDNSPPENKSGITDTKTTIEAKEQPPAIPETKRPMKASRGGSSTAQAQNTNFLLAPPSSRGEQIQQDTTRDLTKIDFDLTQLDTTPREKSVEQNEKILQEIALKIEQEISNANSILKNENTKVDKSHFKEVSLSFETSTFIRDGIIDRPLEDVINQTNQYLGYNPIMEPQTSSDPEQISLMNSKIMQGMIQHPTSDSEVQRANSQPHLLEKLKDHFARKSIEEKKHDTPGFRRTSSTSSIGKEILKLRKSVSHNSSDDNKSHKSIGKPQTAKFKISSTSLANLSIKSKSRDNSLAKEKTPTLDSPQEEQKITTPAKVDSPGTPNPKDSGSKPQKAEELAQRLAKLKRPSQLNSYRKQKSVRDISFNNTKANMSMNQSNAQNSVMTDNSERLKDTLEQFKKSKLIKELKGSTRNNDRELKKQQTLDPTSKSSNKVPLAAPRSSRK